MSSVSALRSSSRRSTRSMNDFRCSFAKPDFAIAVRRFPRCADPTPPASAEATQCAILALGLLRRGLRRRESRLLFRRRVLLVARFPFRLRHAVDDRARLVFREREALRLSGIAVPVAETVAAEAAMDHQIDVLHI